MTVLKYKDFQGSVTFEDGTLVLQILHTDDLIVAEWDSASKVEETFQEPVDDYLALRRGAAPNGRHRFVTDHCVTGRAGRQT